MYELKIYRRILCHDNKNDEKFELGLTCQCTIDMRNFH